MLQPMIADLPGDVYFKLPTIPLSINARCWAGLHCCWGLLDADLDVYEVITALAL